MGSGACGIANRRNGSSGTGKFRISEQLAAPVLVATFKTRDPALLLPMREQELTKTDEAQRRRRIGRLLIATAVAILVLLIIGGTLTSWMIYQATRKPAPMITVASFRADYQEGTPLPGWAYLWNPSGEIGKTNNYRDLIWNGQAYAFDDNPSLPRAAPA